MLVVIFVVVDVMVLPSVTTIQYDTFLAVTFGCILLCLLLRLMTGSASPKSSSSSSSSSSASPPLCRRTVEDQLS